MLKKFFLLLIFLGLPKLSAQEIKTLYNSKKVAVSNDTIAIEKVSISPSFFKLQTIEGKEIVKPQYNKIELFGDFQEKWALVEIGKLSGFINHEGKETVRPIYDKIAPWGDYQEKWALVETGGLLGFIDIDGKEIVKPKYENIENEENLEGIIKGKRENLIPN